MDAEKTPVFHKLRPDYSRPAFVLSEDIHDSILHLLTDIYSAGPAKCILKDIERLMAVYYAHKTDALIEFEQSLDSDNRFTEKDAVLITYGDLIRGEGAMPLAALSDLCEKYLKDAFNTLHILPFFPYSSDRGFAVLDFMSVDPNLGTWENIRELKRHFGLMFDGVFNHISSKSNWFQEFLNNNPRYRNFFISYSGKSRISQKKISMLFRPRTSDVFTSFPTLKGQRKVWTTFGPDQVDLNFKNPQVLLKVVEILLYYVRRGADIVRLDAVTYLWKELGTDGVHHKNTHQIIKILRQVLKAAAPHVALVTETNVPHQYNISYLGNGGDEAQMVYNFALPPLVLHTFLTGNSSKLTGWAQTLDDIPEKGILFNFLDSHDGIGIMGAKGVLTDSEIDAVVENTIENGGLVSFKKDSDGRETPYELNITSFSALGRAEPGKGNEFRVRRYLAARSIQMVLAGVPGIYLHGLMGSENDIESVQITTNRRDINRKNLSKQDLFEALHDKNSTAAMVAGGISRLLKLRQSEKSFHPYATQKVLNAGDAFFCICRGDLDGDEIITTVNITGEQADLHLTLDGRCGFYKDLLSDDRFEFDNGKLSITIEPYRILWLKKAAGR